MNVFPSGTITLLFSDIEGSTALLQRLGSDYGAVLEEHRRLLRAAFAAHGGHENDVSGDAFFVSFARAVQAVAAAAQAQQALAAHAWPEGVALRVRMGLHTGEPTVADHDYVGIDVHRAARIMAAAHGGQVLLSQTTRDLVRSDLPSGVTLRDVGEYHLKDLQAAEHLYQLEIASLPSDFPPLRALEGHPHNLPSQSTPLLGREEQLAECRSLLQQPAVRLLSLSGPGGTGKTRLGLQVADMLRPDFADGVFWVALAPIRDPQLVPSAIAGALGAVEGEAGPTRAVRDFLRDRHLLLMLDNFEQVTPAASFVGELLADCPRLKVLVTSRVVLHLRGEREFAVPPLALPPLSSAPDQALPSVPALSQFAAVALFIQRAQAVKPDFAVTNENASAVAELCTRLDGLPLAIELAAARIKVLSPQAMLSRLNNRLQFLTGGPRDVASRQQTLSNAIAWSYDLLESNEQRLFCRLSVFSGESTLEAAEAVCCDEDSGEESDGDVLDALAGLTDKSLLRTKEKNGQARFFMLETIREFSAHKLEESSEAPEMRRRHAAYFLKLAQAEHPAVLSPDARQRLECAKRMEFEEDNFRAALSWSLQHEPETAMRLVDACSGFWHHRVSEAGIAAERALERGRDCEPSLVSAVLGVAAGYAGQQGNFARQRELALQRLALVSGAGQEYDRAWALHTLGQACSRLGEFDQARKSFEDSLEIFRGSQKWQCVGWVLNSMGDSAALSGDLDGAWRCFEASGAAFEQTGDRDGLAGSMAQRAEIARQRGDLATARELFAGVAQIERDLGDTRLHPWRRYQLGHLEMKLGHLEIAAERFRTALRGCLAVHEGSIELRLLLALACLACAQKQSGRAVILLAAEAAQRELLQQEPPLAWRDEREQCLSNLRQELPADEFDRLWRTGSDLSRAAAIAFALEESCSV